MTPIFETPILPITVLSAITILNNNVTFCKINESFFYVIFITMHFAS